jgi:hypothetical protein
MAAEPRIPTGGMGRPETVACAPVATRAPPTTPASGTAPALMAHALVTRARRDPPARSGVTAWIRGWPRPVIRVWIRVRRAVPSRAPPPDRAWVQAPVRLRPRTRARPRPRTRARPRALTRASVRGRAGLRGQTRVCPLPVLAGLRGQTRVCPLPVLAGLRHQASRSPPRPHRRPARTPGQERGGHVMATRDSARGPVPAPDQIPARGQARAAGPGRGSIPGPVAGPRPDSARAPTPGSGPGPGRTGRPWHAAGRAPTAGLPHAARARPGPSARPARHGLQERNAPPPIPVPAGASVARTGTTRASPAPPGLAAGAGIPTCSAPGPAHRCRTRGPAPGVPAATVRLPARSRATSRMR